ncbi:MAG TPA: XTP/dITP diphosphatase [Desulfobacteraceae bacterium]|nr:XTP/dITP diphosphatase [Desulfobacteraceae bacterium]
MNYRGPLVVATRNEGKLREFRELLAPFGLAVKGLGEFPPIAETVEDGETFEANAVKKASFAAEKLGLATLADDSGLVVPALGGAPGVYSSRYAGEGSSDSENIRKLLEEMKGAADRRASFFCVIAVACPGGGTRTYTGSCTGVITFETSGRGGFGYDPVFYYPPLKATFGEIGREEKNSVSHRGKAMLALKADFERLLQWLEPAPFLEAGGLRCLKEEESI